MDGWLLHPRYSNVVPFHLPCSVPPAILPSSAFSTKVKNGEAQITSSLQLPGSSSHGHDGLPSSRDDAEIHIEREGIDPSVFFACPSHPPRGANHLQRLGWRSSRRPHLASSQNNLCIMITGSHIWQCRRAQILSKFERCVPYGWPCVPDRFARISENNPS